MSERQSTRRRVLRVAGGVGAVALAGCLGAVDDSTSTEDEAGVKPYVDMTDPERTVVDFYDHLDEGAVDDANALLHSDSDLTMGELSITPFEISDVTVEDLTLGEHLPEQADADVRVSLSRPERDEDAVVGGTVELRVNNSIDRYWRLYDVPHRVEEWYWEPDTATEEPAQEPTLPADAETAIEEFYQALDDGDRDSLEDRTHPDGRARDVADAQLEDYEAGSIRITDLRAESVGDDVARAKLTEVESPSYTDDESTEIAIVELRSADGGWLVYSREYTAGETGSAGGG